MLRVLQGNTQGTAIPTFPVTKPGGLFSEVRLPRASQVR